jgi:hypothetical protein
MANGDDTAASTGGTSPAPPGLFDVMAQSPSLYGVFPTQGLQSVSPNLEPWQVSGRGAVATTPAGDSTEMVGLPDPDAAGALKGAQAIASERLATTERTNEQFEARMRRDQDMVRAQWNATSHAASDLPPPWNADAEAAARISSPFERFGSAATVFATLASTFSKQPAVAALNSAAAAMNAIRESDEAGYERAYTAWKNNTDLMVKRFNMQHTLFSDTLSVFNTDITAWKAKSVADAAKFEDKTALNFLNNGMFPEYIKYMDGLAKARDSAIESQRAVEIWRADKKAADTQLAQLNKEHGEGSFEPWTPDVRAVLQQAVIEQNVSKDPVKRLVGQFVVESMTNRDSPSYGKKPTAQELADFEKNAKAHVYQGSRTGGASTGSANAEIARRAEEYEKDPDSETSGDKTASYAKAAKEVTAERRAQPVLTPGRVDAQERVRLAQEYENDPKSPTYRDPSASFKRADKEVKEAGQSLTANERAKFQTHYDQFTEEIKTLNEILNVLQNYPGAAGISGKVMRLGERLGNILIGTDETERVDMMRKVEELQVTGPQLIMNRATGRPLTAEGGHVKSIIAGLAIGDTGPNTISALENLKGRYQRAQKKVQDIIEGTWKPEPSTPPASSGAGGDWWSQDKPVD